MKHILMVLTLMMLGATPAGADPDTDTAEQAMINWLQILDAQKYDESWLMAGSIFRNQISKTQWAQAVAAARATFGALKHRQIVSSSAASKLPNAPAGEYLIVRTRVTFDQKEATETVTAVLENGDWRAVGYFIK